MKGGREAVGGGFAAFTPLAARARGWLTAAVRVVGVTHGRRTPGAAPWLSRAFQSFPPPQSTRHRDAAGRGPLCGHPLTLLLLSSSACPVGPLLPAVHSLGSLGVPAPPSPRPTACRSCQWLSR